MKNTKKPLSLLFIIAFAISIMSFAPSGKVYLTHTGHVWFFSKTTMENIEAHNYQVGANLNSGTGDMAFSILIKSFKFKKALMEDHFNENYLESDKYPKSTFKGKIANISSVNFDKNGSYKVNVTGDLNMHNVTKSVNIPGIITVTQDSVYEKSNFTVALKDYNIEVPSVVKDKISETIDIHVDVAYSKK